MTRERYELVRALGEGGMGAVQLVHDRERGELVAQKRLRAMTPAALLRFKREFRVIERLLHPGLVRLYELGEDAAGVYFTMEHVEGGDLGRYCAGLVGASSGATTTDPTLPAAYAPTLDTDRQRDPARTHVEVDLHVALPRLLHVLPQLVEALSFLHGHGIVHRDIKPANVLVDERGAAKLADFGVLASLREPVGEVRTAIGTLGFMAPEQLRGAEPTPTNDLYALGAMIMVLLSGRPLFDGTPMAEVVAHLEHAPPRLDTLAPGAPPALVELCAALLAKDPAARPDLGEVARMLERAGARPAILARPEPARTELIGRAHECAQLTRALLGRDEPAPTLTIVRGASGMGKSALAAWAAEEAARHGATVLSGRGRVNDRLPFNAVDGAIDQLATTLARDRRLPDDVQRAIGQAAIAFPVLADLAAPEPVGVRTIVFDALTRLVEHVARGGGALLAIDDLQWADADSIALVRHIVRAASPRVKLLATMRDDEPNHEALALEQEPRARVLELGPLDDGSLRRLADEAARAAGAAPSEDALAAVVLTARGRPFLAELAGRALARPASEGDPLAPVVRDAIEGHGPLLAALVAADGWAQVGALAELVGASAGALEERVRDLAHAGVVRRAGPLGVAGAVDVYHDVVRAALARALPREAVRAAHDGFVRAIGAGPHGATPPQRLVRHLLGAERFEEAGYIAREAAEAAEHQLAFALAADMYEVAIEHGGADDLDLLRRHALALERCARYARAAASWEALAARGGPQDALHGAMNAAYGLLAANRVEQGLRRLDDALVAAGDPPLAAGGPSRWWAVLRYLAGPSRVSPRRFASPELVRARADCDRKLGTMVGYFDPYAGIRMLLRARHAYAQLGAWEPLAGCDYLFAAFAEHGSASSTTPRLVRAYRDAADAVRAAHAPDDRRLRTSVSFLDASVHLRAGRWDEAVRDFDACISGLAEVGDRGVFEQTYALSQIAFVAVVRHDAGALEEAVSRYERESDIHESAVLSHRVLYEAVLATMRGRFAEASRSLERVRAALPERVPSVQRAVAVIVERYPALYDPDADARPLDAREHALVDQFRILRINCGGFYAACLALTEAAALRRGRPDASRRRLARY
ncbi:MAG: protein kinase, partial [Sandaracinaceae bacterium]|nr:protein kinase [Sandaracinaceae bacterium]